MTAKEVLFEVKKRFEEELDRKTGWGKEEVKKLYDKVMIDVLTEQLV